MSFAGQEKTNDHAAECAATRQRPAAVARKLEIQNGSMNIQKTELEILVYWMTERDRIRAQKAQGLPRPWTTDPLLRDYRWCNVRRMDDRVSVDMLQRWYRHSADPVTVLTAACLGRLVNWPDSLMAITGGWPFEREHLENARWQLLKREAAGLKIFTGAYVVPGRQHEAKTATVMRHAVHVETFAVELYRPSMRATWGSMTQIEGLGSFLVGQMVADIAHLQAGQSWGDRHTWAPLGPGSARGINRLFGRPKDKAVGQAQFEQELPALMEVLYPLVQPLWDDRQLQAMDIQNCLCEFDKYRRLTLKEGTVRSRYDGVGTAQEALL